MFDFFRDKPPKLGVDYASTFARLDREALIHQTRQQVMREAQNIAAYGDDTGALLNSIESADNVYTLRECLSDVVKLIAKRQP